MDARRACHSPQIEIDECILDYLLYRATQALLRERRTINQRFGRTPYPSQADTLLELLEQYIVVFYRLHPQHKASASSKFRLRLLKFTAAFTRRLQHIQTSPSLVDLQSLRHEARARAALMSKEQNTILGVDLKSLRNHKLLSDSACKSNRDRFLREIGYAPAIPDHYGTERSFSLLDSLPGFIALSAAQNALQESTITVIWMELAARYMAQAVLEQYLMHGASTSDALQEAFVWGFNPKLELDEGSDDYDINVMFYGDEQYIAAWKDIKIRHIRAVRLGLANCMVSALMSVQLSPPEGTSLEHHLASMASQDLSPVAFEECMLDFLEGLLNGQSKPFLVQLELEEIEGLSTSVIRQLKERAGISVT